jgi:hypothetical protein
MAKAYVATEFTDKDGTHEVGAEIELPRNTEEEQESFDTLLRYGIIATTPQRAERIATGESDPQPPKK